MLSLLSTSGSKCHCFHMLCAGWEDQMGREASLRDMTVVVVVAAHWWGITPLKREQSLSFSQPADPTAVADLCFLSPPFPSLPPGKAEQLGETKADNFSTSGGHHEQGWNPSTHYTLSACVDSCCHPLYHRHSPVGCHLWRCTQHEWKRVCWMGWGKSMWQLSGLEGDE